MVGPLVRERSNQEFLCEIGFILYEGYPVLPMFHVIEEALHDCFPIHLRKLFEACDDIEKVAAFLPLVELASPIASKSKVGFIFFLYFFRIVGVPIVGNEVRGA